MFEIYVFTVFASSIYVFPQPFWIDIASTEKIYSLQHCGLFVASIEMSCSKAASPAKAAPSTARSSNRFPFHNPPAVSADSTGIEPRHMIVGEIDEEELRSLEQRIHELKDDL